MARNPTERVERYGKLMELALRETRLQLAVAGLAARGVALVAGVVLYALAVVLADHLVVGGLAPQVMRLLRIGFVLFIALGAAAILIGTLARRVSDLYAAWLLERGHPEHKNSIINAVQLARGELPEPTRTAVVISGGRAAARSDVREAVDLSNLRRAAWATVAALLLMAGYAVIGGKPVLPSLQRWWGAAIAAPTRTRLIVHSPDPSVPVLEGGDVVFQIEARGARPDELFVDFATLDRQRALPGQQMVAERDQARSGQYRCVKPGRYVHDSMLFRVRGGDAKTPWRRLEVRPHPGVIDMLFHLRPPDYTGLPGHSTKGPLIEAVVGTRVDLEAGVNVPVERGSLRFDGAETRLLQSRKQAPHRLFGSFFVVESGTFRVCIVDRWGDRNQRPIVYHIKALPDQPPRVRLVDPGGPLQADVNQPIRFAGVAADDFGLLSLSIVADGPVPVRSQLWSPGDDQRQRARFSAVLTPRDLGGRPGQTVRCWVEATDNRHDLAGNPAPQRGRSATVLITVRDRPASATPAAPRGSNRRAERKAEIPEVDSARRAAGSPAAERDDVQRSREYTAKNARREETDKPIETAEEFARKYAEQVERVLDHFASSKPRDRESAADAQETDAAKVQTAQSQNRRDPQGERPAPPDADESAQNNQSGADHPPGTPKEEPGADRLAPDSRGDARPHAGGRSVPQPGDGPESPQSGQGPSPVKPDTATGESNRRQIAEDRQDGAPATAQTGEAQSSERPQSERPGKRSTNEKQSSDGRIEARKESGGRPGPGESQASDAARSAGRPDLAASNKSTSRRRGRGEDSGDALSASRSRAGQSPERQKQAAPSGAGQRDARQSDGEYSGNGSDPGRSSPSPEGGASRDAADGRGPAQRGSGPAASAGPAKGQASPAQTTSNQPARPGQDPAGSSGNSGAGSAAVPGSRPGGGASAAGQVQIATNQQTTPGDGAAKPSSGRTKRLTSIGLVDKAVNELERQRRRGGYDPSLLKGLNWTPAQADRFVRAWRNIKASSWGNRPRDARGSSETPAAARPLPGSNRVLASETARTTIGTAVNRPGTTPDGTTGVSRRGRIFVPPAYRDLLDAYFQSMSAGSPDGE